MSDENNQAPAPGVFCWQEIISSDPEGAKKFYSGMFGWTSEDIDMGSMTYTMFKMGEKPVAGMVQLTPEMEEMGIKPHILDYISVEDIAEAVTKAKELGAQIHTDVTEIPMGKFAILSDPGGIGFAFWQHNAEADVSEA